MSRFDLFDNLQKANKLPEGHYEKAKAELAMNKEYEKSRAQEMEFQRKLPKRFRGIIEPRLAEKVVSELCSMIGTREPKMVFESKAVHPLAAAHCGWKELHFKYQPMLITIIHELAHHVISQEHNRVCFSSGLSGEIHGERFLWTEQFLFNCFMDEILPVWKLKEQGLI